MKHRLLFAAIATVAAFVAVHAGSIAHASLAVGTTMPGVTEHMKSTDGRDLTLAQVKGEKGTLIIFSCNHCPWAQKWEERIVAIGNDYSKQGIGVAVVNSNDPSVFPDDSFENMRARAKERGMAYPYLYDATSDVARAFGAEHTPEAFLFDPAGHLVYHGTIDDNANDPSAVTQHYLKDALDALLGGREIAVKETKALGCGIRYRAGKTGEAAKNS